MRAQAARPKPLRQADWSRCPHGLLPLTLTLSPRREERRGERGCAHRPLDRPPAAGGLVLAPSRATAPHPTLSPRRENAAGEGTCAPARRLAPPLPIVLHDGERVGVRGGCAHRPLDRPPCGRRVGLSALHVLLPLTLTLSPRREERRGERGRAHRRGETGGASPPGERARTGTAACPGSPSFFTMGRGSA